MRLVPLALLVSGLFLAACGSTTTMQFYPVNGPLSKETPPPVIVAKAGDPKDNSGPLSFRLPDRTKCEGTWTTVAPRVQSRERGLSLSIRDLGGKMTRTTETVGGVNRGEVYAVCRDGTIVQGSFAIGSGTTSGSGTAVDTRGNSFKLLF